MSDLKSMLATKGFTQSQIETVMETVETVNQNTKMRKEVAVLNPVTQKLQLLSETTLDYVLPPDEVRYFERTIGDWVETS